MENKILLADDHSIYRAGLKSVLQRLIENVHFVEAGTYPQACELIAQNQGVALALVDLKMPGMNHVTQLEELVVKGRDIPVVVLSASDSVDDVNAAFKCGVMGYIVKTEGADVILQALRLVLSGGLYLPPVLLDSPVQGSHASASDVAAAVLTDRQREVLKLLVNGEPNKTIARRLGLSEATVKAHLGSILKSLNARNRTQAVMAAQKMGIVG